MKKRLMIMLAASLILLAGCNNGSTVSKQLREFAKACDSVTAPVTLEIADINAVMKGIDGTPIRITGVVMEYTSFALLKSVTLGSGDEVFDVHMDYGQTVNIGEMITVEGVWSSSVMRLIQGKVVKRF